MECLEAHAPNDAENDGLRSSVEELSRALAEKRGEVELLKQICFTVLQEVRALSAQVGTLTEAPPNQESRLDQAVARVVDAAFESRLPIIGDLISAGIAEQFEIIGLRLDASTRQLMNDAESASGAFQDSVAAAASHMTALSQTAQFLRADVTALDIAGRETAVATAKAVAGVAGAAAQVNGAMLLLPAAAAAVTDAASAAARRLVDAASGVSAQTLAMADAANAARELSAAMSIRAGELVVASEAFVDGARESSASIAVVAGAAVTRLATMIEDAESGRQGGASVTQLAEQLESVAVSLIDSAYRLDGSGLRFTQAAEGIADRLITDSARGEALLTALPDMAAEATDAAMALRDEAVLLRTAAAEAACTASDATVHSRGEIELLRATATEAVAVVTAAAVRAETSAAALERAGHLICKASESLAADAGRLEAVAATTAPDVAAPDPALVSNAMLSSMAERLCQLSEAVRRVEDGVDGQDKIWASVSGSLTEICEAAQAMSRTETAHVEPMTVPSALLGTLRHSDAVARESEMLLRHAELLAEAVLSGRSEIVPEALSGRTPDLLTAIEVAAQRLRSAATALALAGDGAAPRELRIA